jgi:hypothetical protein
MSTKEMPGPFDGMARAEPDEPVFTLRAHDPLAPGLVHEWVDRRRKAIREAFGREEITEAKRELELLQCREAEELAWSMEAWRKGEIGKLAEALEERAAPPAAYSGHTASDEELAAKVRYDAIKAAGSLLSNAIAGITDAATDHLAPHGFQHERAVILTVADRLKAVASHIAPRRASYAAGEPELEPLHLENGLITGAHLCDLLAELEDHDADPSRQ